MAVFPDSETRGNYCQHLMQAPHVKHCIEDLIIADGSTCTLDMAQTVAERRTHGRLGARAHVVMITLFLTMKRRVNKRMRVPGERRKGYVAPVPVEPDLLRRE